uniref:CHK domain-containing protein n=1 Tax=Caenorhabditis tropicalis TaxID=1561998 RepID=A0A1I7UPX6_9PELO
MESNVVALNREMCRSRKSSMYEFMKILQLRLLSIRVGNIREHEFFSRKFDNQLLPIGRHGLTAGWLIDSMDQILSTDNIRNIKCHQLGSDGFVSQIMRVTVEFTNNEIGKYIVKMPETTNIKAALEMTTQQKMPEGADEQFIGGLTMFFNREVDFYLMDKIPGMRLPQCFHSQRWDHGKTTGAIVMQDLQDMVSVPYYDSLNLQQIASIGSQLLNLHVFSIGLSNEWKEKFPFPMQFIDTVSNMTDIVKLYVSRNPVLQECFSKVEKMYNSRALFVHLLRDSHKILGIDDFLCHGDLWFYNLMWLPTVAGSDSASDHLGAIIDWQNIHTGSIAEDFCHMLTFCCDTKTRRFAERTFLPYYFKQLKSKAKEAGKKLNLTLSQFLRAYRRNFVAHALHLPFITSIMLCVKPAEDEEVQRARNEDLIEKVLGAWEDALEVMHDEYPNFPF